MKSPGLRLRQRLMKEALEAGNRKAARLLARAAAEYRKGDRVIDPIPYGDGDWLDRCGWQRNVR